MLGMTAIGRTGVRVSAIGFGGMPLSIRRRPSEEQAIRVIHRALELGVTLIDTADCYCLDETDMHHNERLVSKALRSYGGDASGVVVATKGGLVRPGGRWEVDGDPARLARTIRESFEALGDERPIGLWQLHAPDPDRPIEESLAPAAEAQREGLIRLIGVSNFSVGEIERARRVVDVVSVQNCWNPWCRDPERDGILPYCEREGLTFLPWSPLGGSRRVRELDRIQGIAGLAAEKRVSAQRLVLAWLMAKSPCVIPIPAATRIESLEDSLAAASLRLSPEEVARIDSARA